MNANELLHNTGGGQYYKHLGNLLFTEGVNDACEKFQCFWFVDVCLSYQSKRFQEKNEFQVWKLKRRVDNEFEVICEDGDDNELLRQLIEFSDFRHDELTFWFTNGVLLLPSEY
jgi:hypothetical protein